MKETGICKPLAAEAQSFSKLHSVGAAVIDKFIPSMTGTDLARGIKWSAPGALVVM
jgi:hypothetical protein